MSTDRLRIYLGEQVKIRLCGNEYSADLRKLHPLWRYGKNTSVETLSFQRIGNKRISVWERRDVNIFDANGIPVYLNALSRDVIMMRALRLVLSYTFGESRYGVAKQLVDAFPSLRSDSYYYESIMNGKLCTYATCPNLHKRPKLVFRIVVPETYWRDKPITGEYSSSSRRGKNHTLSLSFWGESMCFCRTCCPPPIEKEPHINKSITVPRRAIKRDKKIPPVHRHKKVLKSSLAKE